MDIKTFNKNLKFILASGTKLDALVHETACGGLALCEENRDARFMDQLFQALPKGYRKEGYKVWVQTYSPVRWNGDGKIGLLKAEAKNFTPFNVDEAKLNPFWTLEQAKEKTAREIDLNSLLIMIDRMVKMADKADDDGNVTDDDGKVTAKITGNVISFKSRVHKIRELAAKEIAAPVGVVIPAQDVLIRDGVQVAA